MGLHRTNPAMMYLLPPVTGTPSCSSLLKTRVQCRLDQPPATSHQPPTNIQHPTSNIQQPTTNNQQPQMNKQLNQKNIKVGEIPKVGEHLAL
jgi:hypothetical protein